MSRSKQTICRLGAYFFTVGSILLVVADMLTRKPENPDLSMILLSCSVFSLTLAVTSLCFYFRKAIKRLCRMFCLRLSHSEQEICRFGVYFFNALSISLFLADLLTWESENLGRSRILLLCSFLSSTTSACLCFYFLMGVKRMMREVYQKMIGSFWCERNEKQGQ